MAQRVIKLRQIACQNFNSLSICLLSYSAVFPLLTLSLPLSLYFSLSVSISLFLCLSLSSLLLQKQLSSALFALFIFAASTNRANCHNRPRLLLVHPAQLAWFPTLFSLSRSLSLSLSLNATCIICIAKWAKSRQNKADCCGPPFLSLLLFGYPFRLNNVAELCVRFIT